MNRKSIQCDAWHDMMSFTVTAIIWLSTQKKARHKKEIQFYFHYFL